MAGLTVKRRKSSWGQWMVEFLGHEIGEGTMSVPAAQVTAI